MFSRSKFVGASLKNYWRIHIAVALGVAAATAVLTGALLVGDSMRGSLRHLALDRLGKLDTSILSEHFFRPQLAAELAAEQPQPTTVVPGIYLVGTLENAESKRRASNTTVLGCEANFSALGSGGPTTIPQENQIVLNQPLASELQVQVGDEIILRIGQISQIPADTPLGRKTDLIRNRRLTVSEILPATGLARFGLRPNQQLPFNAFANVQTLAEMVEQPDKVNALFATGPIAEASFHPTLADLGYELKLSPQGYFNFTSQRMLLSPAAVQAAERAFVHHTIQPAFTYLANYLKTAGGKGKIPYSTVTAIDFTTQAPLGPFTTADGTIIDNLRADEIVVNRWAADDLAKQGVTLQPGDSIELEFFKPENFEGVVKETGLIFRLKAVAEMIPSVADRDFTPELLGVTDQKSIDNWDPPFPYDPSRVRSRKPHDEDEAYWDQYQATPKAFVALKTGQDIWHNRFGNLTSLRIVPQPQETLPQAEKKLLAELNPFEVGFQLLPVREWGLAASSGTTPFSLLFLGFSFFIIASALILVALLFRLGAEQRARELGLFLALGWQAKQVARLWFAEAAIVAMIGGFFGSLIGIGYAWLMLYGLKTWWLAAIRAPFLQLYVTPLSLILGFGGGTVISLLTIAFTLRRMKKIPVRRLVAGEATEDVWNATRSRRRWLKPLAIGLFCAAVALVLFARGLSGEAQAGAFFGSAALLLISSLLVLTIILNRPTTGLQLTTGAFPLARLAWRNAARNTRRSLMVISLVASAIFLIVAISAFRLDPQTAGNDKNSGSGGFELIAHSDQPIFQDLNTEAGRAELNFSAEDEKLLQGVQIFGLREKAGDDASCLNLYQVNKPRIVGLPEKFIQRGGFTWADSLASMTNNPDNPWALLRGWDNYKLVQPNFIHTLARQLGITVPYSHVTPNHTTIIPIVLDYNTAAYSLHVGLEDSIPLVENSVSLGIVVGLLKNSIFQGDVLMEEEYFKRYFPEVNGYNRFVIQMSDPLIHPASTPDTVQAVLESTLNDYGFDVERSSDVLANFFAVQNTYLSTFQSLGGLGLLLGTFGLVAVQLRSVFERRGELALLRACGFSKRRLAQLVLLENGLLLATGLAVGVLSALVAVLPHWWSGSAQAPWLSLTGTILAIFGVGLAAGSIAVRAALQAPLVTTLRNQ